MRTTNGYSGYPVLRRIIRLCLLLALLSLYLPGATARPAGPDPEPDPSTPGVVATLPPPHLRYPDAQPEPVPKFDPEKQSSHEGPVEMVSYDVKTGEITRRPSVSPDDLLGPRYTEAGIGVLELLENPELTDKNFADWTLVGDPTAGTYPRRVKIWVTYHDTDGIPRDFVSSGTLIDPLHVLTAAHCIYKHENDDPAYTVNDYADEVTIAPAYHDEVYPFGWVESRSLLTWSGWTNSEDFEYDVALIELEWPIGAVTGSFGYGYNPNDSWFLEGSWHHAAYPADIPFTGLQMFETSGNYDFVHPLDNVVSWANEGHGGTSGGGAVRDGMVWAVRSHSSDLPVMSHDCPVDDFMFGDIETSIAGITPDTPDFVPLCVRGDTVTLADANLDPLTFVLTNYSSAAWSGAVDYDIYLSLNDAISPADIKIASTAIPVTLGPKGSTTVPIPTVHVPASIAAGEYWLGVIIDETDAIPGNNDSSGWQAMPLEVQCQSDQAPTRNLPLPIAECLDAMSVTFDWTDMPGAVAYELQILPLFGGDREYYTTTLSQFSHSGLQWNTAYRWDVRQRSGCTGDWGPWSDYWRNFSTAPDPDESPVDVYPGNSAYCVPPDTVLSWAAPDYAVSYEVQVGSECQEGGIHATTANEWPVSLRAGRTYYWRLRTETDCGDWNNWGPCRWFRTRPDSVGVSKPLLPQDGTECAAPEAELVWEDDPEAGSWEVQLGTICGVGEVIPAPENTLVVPRLSGGVDYVWRVRMINECGMIGDWSPCATFQVDTIPPIGATKLQTVTHTVGVWSPVDVVGTTWDPGHDECDPEMYSLLWDEYPDTEPDDEPETGNPHHTSASLDDGEHWFHLRTLDPAGNHADPDLHLGPILIDDTPPGAAEILYTTVDPDSPGGHPSVWCAWLPATDKTSGIEGYSWRLDPSELAQPDATVETAETRDRARFTAEGSTYFHVLAVDRAGNTGAKRQAGPFVIDLDLIGTELQRPDHEDVLTEGHEFAVTWTLEVPAGRSVVGGTLSFSVDAGQSWHDIGSLRAADVLAGSWAWTPPAAGTTTGALRLQVVVDLGVRVTTKSELFSLQQVSATPDALSSGRFALVGNTPNPFNPRTIITYELPRACSVSLRIYDMRGHSIRTLVDDYVTAPQRCQAVWDGADDRGRRVAGGVYFYRLKADDYTETKRMVLLK